MDERIVLYEDSEIVVEVNKIFDLLAQSCCNLNRKTRDLSKEYQLLINKKITEYLNEFSLSNVNLFISDKVPLLTNLDYLTIDYPFDIFNRAIELICNSDSLEDGVVEIENNEWCFDNSIKCYLTDMDKMSGILMAKRKNNIYILPFLYKNYFIEEN